MTYPQKPLGHNYSINFIDGGTNNNVLCQLLKNSGCYGNLQLLIMGTIKIGLFDQVSADNLMTDLQKCCKSSSLCSHHFYPFLYI